MSEPRKQYPFAAIEKKWQVLGDEPAVVGGHGGDIDRDAIVAQFGADALRLYVIYSNALEPPGSWNAKGVEGMFRFLSRIWSLCMECDAEGCWELSDRIAEIEPTNRRRKVLHETIKSVTADIDAGHPDRAISQLMVCAHDFAVADRLSAQTLATFLRLLNPFAPHLSEELNERLCAKFVGFPSRELAGQEWPQHDESFLVETEIGLAVQVNGKRRDTITVAIDAPCAAIERQALAGEKIQPQLEGKAVRRVIVVPGKLVNIVVD